MSFFLDLVFVTLSGVLVNVLSAVFGLPVTLFTEFLLGLFAPGP